MELFSSKEVRQFTTELMNKINGDIQSFSDQKIKGCDDDEWVEYYYSKYSLYPIVLYENNITQSMIEEKIKKYNHWHKHNQFENEYFMIDGYCIVFTIPYDGSAELLKLKPSTYIMTSFEVVNLVCPSDDNYGEISLEFKYTNQELKEKDNPKQFVDGQFRNKFDNYKKMIGYVNSEIESFNSSIRDKIKHYLNERRKKATDYEMISEKLNIPLQMSGNAPNISPIPLKRVERLPKVSLPQNRPISKEYSISDSDYKNINRIIHTSCTAMEDTARTFNKIGEEELRDIIISNLSTHYIQQVTGETFRKVGKTDIHISFENKSAFIGECKIWHGIKNFEEAINQLMGYSTWKDSKTSLIIFNKKNKDFGSVRLVIEKWIKENTKRYSQENANVWQCILHRKDINEDINLCVMIYDITI